jgi:hypothetical protein
METVKSDLKEYRLRHGEVEPDFPAGAIFGASEWRDLGRYVRLNGNVCQVPIARGTNVVIAYDPSLPPDAVVWYWLPENLQRHVARLEQ